MEITLPLALKPTAEDIFFGCIETDANGCWRWIKNSNGVFNYGGYSRRASLWAYDHFAAPLPKSQSQWLRRSCQTVTCVNPAHHYVERRRTTVERIKERIIMPDDSHCWVWPGAMGGGAPIISSSHNWSRYVSVRRVLYDELCERLPSDSVFLITPTCGTRRCVNPWHMEVRRSWWTQGVIHA